MQNVPLQLDFCPALPNIFGHKDYNEFRDTLIKIDKILQTGDLENKLVGAALTKWLEDHKEDVKFCKSKAAHHHRKLLHYALRCNIAHTLTGEGVRPFSVRLTDSSLFQWFTGIYELSSRKAASKSSMERFSKMFDDNIIAETLRQWQAETLSDAEQATAIGLSQPVKFNESFLDATCIKANIHFPVDWVLLRDAARSLLLAIKTIRAQGLKHRMINPAAFLKLMNKLCIAMTHTRRKKDSKRKRKNILRKMKKLSMIIAKHGERYRELLLNNLNKTDWSEKQAKQVINRIDNILKQLPEAIKQAHERIIGERKISSEEKILSLYEPDAHVLVRGKAGNEVEFGNGLLLAEQRNGIIVDWELFKDQPKADSRTFKSLMERIQKCYGEIDSATGDRGFDSKSNCAFLKEQNIYNGLCPRSPQELQSRTNEPRFLELQKRRSQTEGRIGIFKNIFLGKPLRSKGFLNKQLNVTWCVLTHNLWVIARMALADEQSEKKKRKKAA